VRRLIAALYVETAGSFYGLTGVDAWEEQRDARLYPGAHPERAFTLLAEIAEFYP